MAPAVDGAHDLFVAHSGNNRILVVSDPFAAFNSTPWPQLPASRGCRFRLRLRSAPAGVAVDSSGDFYLSSELSNQIFIYETAVASSNTTAQVTLGTGASGPPGAL
jgi:hypothetical protein